MFRSTVTSKRFNSFVRGDNNPIISNSSGGDEKGVNLAGENHGLQISQQPLQSFIA